MKIKLIGTGNMISNDIPACYLVNDKIMIDMPNGLVNILKNHKLLDNINYVFITHMHGDHIFDMPFLELEKYKRDKDLNIILSKHSKRKLIKLTKLAFPFKYLQIYSNKNIKIFDNKKEFVIDNLKINRVQVHHGIMRCSYGYVFDDGLKKVFFTGDTCLCDSVKEIAAICDYMVCDATLLEGNDRHMGVNDIKTILEENHNLIVIPSHMGTNSKKQLQKIKNKNLLIKQDMEEIEI